ncbi:hypothetical protein [Oscillibacter sp.]|uniref:hypothetical protein n=1 Tax=Oscillibacter sp. TaxID=1945593 RepID=UPI00257AC0A8|nr:hypothetical protein [Oscillibacter sp.]
MPELVKLISLSELFGVSVDYLVKDWMEEPDNPCGGSGEISSKQADRLEKKVDELTNYVKGRVYRYDSKTRIFGLPLVSIRFGFVRNGKLSMDNTAKGIIAIGNCAIGVVAIGIVGVGLFTFGVLAMGMLSLGIVAGIGGFRRGGPGVSGPGGQRRGGLCRRRGGHCRQDRRGGFRRGAHRRGGVRLRQPCAAVGTA